MWGKVSCLRKQPVWRDWTSNHRTSDLKSKALTTTPLPPYPPLALYVEKKIIIIITISFVEFLAFSVIYTFKHRLLANDPGFLPYEKIEAVSTLYRTGYHVDMKTTPA